VNFYFARDVSRFGNEMENRRENSTAKVFLSVKSKSEPFLYESQKKFRHPPEFQRCMDKHRCRAEGSATRPAASSKSARGRNENSV
jgi:hypothetical protein